MRKRTLLALLILCGGLFFGYNQTSTYLADGFAPSKIQSDLTHDQRWEIPSLSDEERESLLHLLDQPFTYLGKGSQCFVFESNDGEVVLKFFRHRRYQPSSLISLFSKKEYLNKKRKKREALFDSCWLAHQKLREESGLVYLHLNKSDDLNQRVVLKDKLHRHYALPLDSYEFIVQRRAQLIYPYIQERAKKGEMSAARESLSQLLQLLTTRYHQGIGDQDAVLIKNAGFLADRAIFIDIGQFYVDETKKDRAEYQCETERITRRLRKWLGESYPELAAYFEEELSKI